MFKNRKYYMSYDYKHKALWYRTAKVASRTIDNKFKETCGGDEYIYGSLMSYYPWMFKNYFKFSFVRNPETRFVSAWKDKVLKQNYFKFNSSEYPKMKDLDYFISWVEGLDIDNCDEHINSQNTLIDLKNIDFLGRFENFSDDFKIVLEILGIDNDDIVHHNKGINYDINLTIEQRLRIYNIYKKDFQLFYPHHFNTLASKTHTVLEHRLVKP